MARAFVIRPFGQKKDSSGTEIDFERIHNELIAPAITAVELGGGTTGEIVEPGNIREDMFSLILEADVVVCDITVDNANVFYELGIRHALRKRRTLLIRGTPVDGSPPFDILTDRYLRYSIGNPASAKDQLVEAIRAALRSERESDSPIFKMLPGLAEADPSRLSVVPMDFSEEVARVTAAKATGWLSLLAEEVRDRRFQWDGLKLVATAQWDLKDYDGALETWEVIRAAYPQDVAANLAIANLYERLYRTRKPPKPEWLEASEQAIARVLKSPEITRQQRAEALALRGRNEKTRWRQNFQNATTLEDRRNLAVGRQAISSYEAYRQAFAEDLNHFYPGLAALQMGTILLDLANEPAWDSAFDDDDEAATYRKGLGRTLPMLNAAVNLAVDANLARLRGGDPGRIWAEISAADLLFLSVPPKRERISTAYKNAIPRDKPFAWDAARGQLQLFAELGVRAEVATPVIAEVDAHLGDRMPPSLHKPTHLVLFTGHRVDLPGRLKPRFPTHKERLAKELITSAIEELLAGEHQLVGLASGAPGTDILAHEICRELNLKCLMCLPMPPEAYARCVFDDLDGWRTRFLNLVSGDEPLVLGSSEHLPNWLHGSPKDAWERGNQWCMKMALAWGADQTTLIALWDGEQQGDARGGTAHMVKLAKDAGSVHIKRIDSRQLLG